MTDFYSVLKSSIVRRNLRSRSERRDVYEQARQAMIHKLWSLDPPLAEEEIDTRIGLFDAAVERIESDLEVTFAEADTAEAERPRRREAPRRLPPPEPSRQPLVYEGYDEEADYAPAVSTRSPGREARAEAKPQSTATTYRVVYDEPPEPRRREQRAEASRPDVARPAASRPEVLRPEASRAGPARPESTRPQRPAAFAPPPPPPPKSAAPAARRVEADDWDDHDDDFAANTSRRPREEAPRQYEAIPFHEEHYEEAVYEEPPPREAPRRTGAYQAPKYRQDAETVAPGRPDRDGPPNRGDKRQPRAEQWDHDTEPLDEQPFEDEEELYVEVERAAPKKKRKKGKKPARGRADERPEGGNRNAVRILGFTIAGLSIAMIAFCAYVFLPFLFVDDRTTATPAAMPPKLDDRLPVEGASASSARVVADNATASEISERQLNVRESLTVFDGRDPTVFEGSPGNPIRFASDAEGEYAQISSASSAAGARAVIGPGIAERLAGQTVRVTLLARSSAGNGAANLRFAYQSGVAISHWQTAQLTQGYGTYGMIWRVPAADARGGDYLLIEPGIPGDGTSTDIRSITIEIVAS